MDTIFKQSQPFSSRKTPSFQTKLRLCFLLLLFLPLTLFSGCARTVDYAEYLSERRSNVLLYSGENYHVCIYDVEREYPFSADGYVASPTHRTELFISAPDGTTHCSVEFTAKNQTHRGEASFDSVKRQYYFSCNEDVSSLTELTLKITFGEETYEITALSVRTEKTISPNEALHFVVEADQNLFEEMTENHIFLGEIYVRLLYEGAPYYYVGIVNRSGNITAFLLDGETGAILARRDP